MDIEESQAWLDRELTETRFMAILRGFGPERSLLLAERAWELGIGAVEVPVQSDRDRDALATVAAAGRWRQRPVGAGTILSPAHVKAAAEAGASFTVSPGFDPEVILASVSAGLPPLPGVATPSEIQRGAGLGLRWMKVFPAGALGPAWFRAVRGPFPRVRLVATGGLDATNAAEFLGAGAAVVAIGSALEDERELARLAEMV